MPVKCKLWSERRTCLEKPGDPRMRGEDPWQGCAHRQRVGYGATFKRPLSGERAVETGFTRKQTAGKVERLDPKALQP